ncbi:hypothetical protein [Tatumella sp. OPLPL6]|uniref:hypothetical protein n=1 Tax=Tatumella sp. OPLPL6 TaxID=1928657 RepID=UPI000C19A97C|nr:hypothetical protein [Tatumella sp. OPLPL6]PIJ43272.1 hypothetical protein BOM24_08865 [Tatumella sp. OPLPL6]
MADNQVFDTRKMEIDGYTVTFTAGIKSGRPLVVFGIYTNDSTIPLVTLEKEYPSIQNAISYTMAVTEKAGRKLLEYYLSNFVDVVTRVSSAMNSTKITPTPRNPRNNAYYKP